MVPQVGQRIGPYEILGRLGSGGMGLVFSAWDARLQRDVAIKLLREEYASPEMRSRFLQEARAASGLNHPNICTVFDIGEQEGDPYLVMELLKGETLRMKINDGILSTRDILRVAHEIADALSVAHGRGVIHRDIKPANIILVDKAGGNFGTKVLDFGLAKIDTGYDVDSLLDLTHTGTTVGTVSYMSPEQARGEVLDFRSDLFSLGVMLYEMATGRLPFQGATSALVFVQLLSHAPDPIRPQNALITEDLEKLILRLLEKDRNLRFQSAMELMEAVDLIPFKGSGIPRAPYMPVPSPELETGTPLMPPPIGTTLQETPFPRTMADRRASVTPVPVERRNSARLFPRIATSPDEPPTLPVRRGRTAFSSPSIPAAKPSTAPLAPPPTPLPADMGSAAISEDDFIRPVRRVATSESSAYNLRAVRESSAMLPAVPPLPPAVPPSPTLPPAAASGVIPAAHSSPVLPVAPVAPAISAANIPVSLPVLPAARPITTQAVRPISSSQTDIPAMNLPRITSIRPQPRFFVKLHDKDSSSSDHLQAVPPAGFGQPEPVEADDTPKPRMWLLVVALVAMAVIGIVAFNFWPKPAAVAGDHTIPIVVRLIDNKTGDDELSSAFTAGLEIDLSQSPLFLVQIPSGLMSGLRASGLEANDLYSLEEARHGARAIGATEILSGEIRISGNSYVVGLHINSVSTGGEVLRAEESAQSREQLTDAIDRLVVDLRNGLGESSASINDNDMPLSKEATSNLDALQAYSIGMVFLSSGQLDEAATAFEHAVSIDQHFTQPYLRLADIYNQQHAMVAAATNATSALTYAQLSSQRTQWLAQADNAIYASGDLAAVPAITRQAEEAFPATVPPRLQTAMALRLQGKFTDALESAQTVLKHSPYNTRALAEAEMAQIATEHVDAAMPLEGQSARAGHPHTELKLLLVYLTNKEHGPVDTSVDPTGHVALGVMQASLLDAVGQQGASLRLWRAIAANSASQTALASMAADVLSQGSLNRALTGDCGTASQLQQQGATYPQGPESTFRFAMGAALCGNLDAAREAVGTLGRMYPQSFLVKNILVPELNGVVLWKSGDPQGALQTLQGMKAYDLVSMAPYLRGEIHLKIGQPEVAITEFLAVLGHPGATAMVNPLLLPLAQFAQARAYAAHSERANSSAAYTKFLTMWSDADAGESMVGEARANSR